MHVISLICYILQMSVNMTLASQTVYISNISAQGKHLCAPSGICVLRTHAAMHKV